MYKETAWVGWWVDVQWVVLIIKGVRRVRTGRLLVGGWGEEFDLLWIVWTSI